MPVKEFKLIDDIGIDDWHHPLIQAWLDRGDGCAVYENHDLGHPDRGHRKCVSYGSKVAQLEEETPPNRLPDIGSEINWRYVLIGTLRKEVT